MPASVTARQIFRYAWTILNSTATDTTGSEIGDPWEQVLDDKEDVGYTDTIVCIRRTILGDEKHTMPGVEIALPCEDPTCEYLVFAAGMPVRWRKNVLGIPERSHGFVVRLFVPGPWSTYIQTLGKRAGTILKNRPAPPRDIITVTRVRE